LPVGAVADGCQPYAVTDAEGNPAIPNSLAGIVWFVVLPGRNMAPESPLGGVTDTDVVAVIVVALIDPGDVPPIAGGEAK
jgi:hypothetical protein